MLQICTLQNFAPSTNVAIAEFARFFLQIRQSPPLDWLQGFANFIFATDMHKANSIFHPVIGAHTWN